MDERFSKQESFLERGIADIKQMIAQQSAPSHVPYHQMQQVPMIPWMQGPQPPMGPGMQNTGAGYQRMASPRLMEQRK